VSEPGGSKVLLVGMMGAGKTTVGRALADRLGWPFVDTDEVIEARGGRPVAELWAVGGEAAFRVEEADVVAEVTDTPGPAVVSLAGGAVLHPDSRRRVEAAGTVVWLRAEVATLVGRVAGGQSRPLLAAAPQVALQRIEAERRAVYRELATMVIDVDGRTPAEVVEAIAAGVEDGALHA
jgi:shikimate kinase